MGVSEPRADDSEGDADDDLRVLPKVANPDSVGLMQIFPPQEAKPRRIDPGERLVVLIVYQYDDAAPCVGFNTSYFALERDGSVKALRSAKSAPKLPPEVGKVLEAAEGR